MRIFGFTKCAHPLYFTPDLRHIRYTLLLTYGTSAILYSWPAAHPLSFTPDLRHIRYTLLLTYGISAILYSWPTAHPLYFTPDLRHIRYTLLLTYGTSAILYSWPTAHPLYYTSNLLARGFSVVSRTCCCSARPRDCLYPNLTFQIIQNVTVFLVPILQ